MPKTDEQLLLFLAGEAGLKGIAKTSTSKIAKHFGISQQSVSRKLRELKKAGLIGLSASAAGCSVSLSSQGIGLLKERLLLLQQIFMQRQQPKLQGIVKIGLGEGRYYVSRPFYLKQFRELLGFKPFFGTLNLIVDGTELGGFLSGLPAIEIKGFETDERSFGKIIAFKVSVEGKQPGAIILPERTAHPKNEIEIIAAINLRKKFKLKEGNSVKIFSQ